MNEKTVYTYFWEVILSNFIPSHREFRLRNEEAKHVSGKNICWSTLTPKSRGGKIFEFLHCPFEGRANMHHKIQPNWLTGRCCLAGGSKGQCRKSKNFLSLLLTLLIPGYFLMLVYRGCVKNHTPLKINFAFTKPRSFFMRWNFA